MLQSPTTLYCLQSCIAFFKSNTPIFNLFSHPVQLKAATEFMDVNCLMLLYLWIMLIVTKVWIPTAFFCLTGNILPTCDCSLYSSRNVWCCACPLPPGGEFESGQWKFTYVDHGSILKFFLSQGMTWLRCCRHSIFSI